MLGMLEHDLGFALGMPVYVIGYAGTRPGRGVVLWQRVHSEPVIIEYGTHTVAVGGDKLEFSGGEYFPASANDLEAVEAAHEAARRSFAERAGLIPQEVE